MKRFLIKVNGVQYDVEVDEIRDGAIPVQPAYVPYAVSAPAPAAVPVQPAPAAPAAPAAPVAPAVEKKAASGAVGSLKVTAPMPGTIIKTIANPGDKVKKGQVLVVLEAMKMENEIVAPQEGVVATINVSSGDSVNVGDLLASLK